MMDSNGIGGQARKPLITSPLNGNSTILASGETETASEPTQTVTPPGGQEGGGGTSEPEVPEVPPEMAPQREAQCALFLSWLCPKDEEGSGENSVMGVVRLVLNIMTAGVTVLGTIGIIVCGVMMVTARDNEAQMVKARKRLVEIVIGIVAFVLIAVAINLLLPKGDVSDVVGGAIITNSF